MWWTPPGRMSKRVYFHWISINLIDRIIVWFYWQTDWLWLNWQYNTSEPLTWIASILVLWSWIWLQKQTPSFYLPLQWTADYYCRCHRFPQTPLETLCNTSHRKVGGNNESDPLSPVLCSNSLIFRIPFLLRFCCCFALAVIVGGCERTIQPWKNVAANRTSANWLIFQRQNFPLG